MIYHLKTPKWCPDKSNLGFAAKIPMLVQFFYYLGETVYNLLRCIRNTPDPEIVDVDGVKKADEHSKHIIKKEGLFKLIFH